ncbi:MAG: DUF721 domain-containing protein [Actinobacteria bacterium]|jgi:predicted nucleic acid-binding Zn ribbon protein|nr:DUF721 domain-containing protein [Actinomycetota bacterium]
MSDDDDDVVSLSASLDSVVRSLRGPSRAEVGGIFGRWEEAVGEYVARHARPSRFEDGVLLIDVDEPAWVTEIEFRTEEISSRLREMAQVEVAKIEVRVARRRR